MPEGDCIELFCRQRDPGHICKEIFCPERREWGVEPIGPVDEAVIFWNLAMQAH
jgi:hypothetical protein